MTTILKPYTIIPPDLYIARDADRQITDIIEDMGRPGYVLVSRQMGKTNLLLNAKRRLESEENVFVYVDLSNPFESSKSCFENIIDITIDTHETLLAEAKIKISEYRKSASNNPAHKQHTNELRILLKAFKGKLVIILDEIDALTKTPYSDQIFAQIRSVYFSRVNFPEFGRLTYILSGVVEPTEIIKDPKISPFNIGQKIFLNDFSKDEFLQFIDKAKMNLNSEIVNRIYFWTNGNPRISWDVCSEVEKISQIKPINEADIDSLVNEHYLTKYDKPPIDNIRELVQNDRELRDAIVEINYNKGNEVSDKVKSKLYLAGIINYQANDIHIKNEIIKQSLSLDWIRSVEEEDKGLVKVALELFGKEKYSEALSTFERYLADNEFDKQDSSLCYYYMGYASYRSKNFNKTIGYLENTNFDKTDDAKWYYRTLNLKGLSHYYNEQIESGLACFREVINSGRRDEIYARALLNFGSISIKSTNQTHKSDAINIFKSIVSGEELDIDKLGLEFVNELKSIAYFNLAQMQKSDSDKSLVIDNYEKAISLAKPSTKPTMILSLIDVLEKRESRLNQLKELEKLIVEGISITRERDPEHPLDFDFDLLKDVFVIAYLEFRSEVFNNLRQYLNLIGEPPLGKQLYDLAIYTLYRDKNWKSCTAILKELYNNIGNEEYEYDEVTIYNILKLNAYGSDIKKSIKYNQEYIAAFKTNRLQNVDNIDLEIFPNTIFALTQIKQYDEALQLVDTISNLKDEVGESNLINYVVIYHLQLNLFVYKGLTELAFKKANEIISLANDQRLKKQQSNLLGDTGLELIRNNAESVVNSFQKISKPVKRVGRKYGRNDFVEVKYKDGTTKITKFKNVETDIESGACEVVSIKKRN